MNKKNCFSDIVSLFKEERFQFIFWCKISTCVCCRIVQQGIGSSVYDSLSSWKAGRQFKDLGAFPVVCTGGVLQPNVI